MLPLILGTAAIGGWLWLKNKGKPVNTTTSLTLLATFQQISIKLGGTVGVFPPAGGIIVTSTPVLPPTTLANTADKGTIINKGKQAILAPNAGNTGGILPTVTVYNVAWRDANGTPVNTLISVSVS